MADNEADPQVTFKVKTSGDGVRTVTMAESATVLELKTKLASAEYENIPVERQRLIYSGRVMKNDDTIGSYKIKPNNTLHLVKSAASNHPPAGSSSAAAGSAAAGAGASAPPPAVPANMAAGTPASNLLAGLTGARFAGHAPLPSQNIFGPDGGMNLPSEDQLADMMADPSVTQSVNEALNNPSFVDFLLQSNPALRDIPNARQMIQSPLFRRMMTDPESMRMMARMRRTLGGGQGAFPAPGATDSTPSDAPATGAGTGAGAGAGAEAFPFGANPFLFPFGGAGAGAGAGLGAGAGANNNPAAAAANPFLAFYNPAAFQQPAAAGAGTAAGTGAAGAGAAGAPGAEAGAGAARTGTAAGADAGAAANPLAALLGSMPPPAGFPQVTPEMMQQAMQMLGGGFGGAGAGGAGANPFFPGAAAAAAAPPDNRPPEERYAVELRQLNDMGFYNFDQNVAALRRSGGSVEGAVQHLLGD